MIDTRFVTARNGTIALASRAGEVWVRPRGEDSWRHLASAIGHVTCVAAN
jgi:hypothetical protein